MNTKLARLKKLQSRADALRNELGFSRPGEVTFFATPDGWDNEVVVVEADGLGEATVKIVIGNYPVDYYVRRELHFSTEHSAQIAAERLAFSGDSPDDLPAALSQR